MFDIHLKSSSNETLLIFAIFNGEIISGIIALLIVFCLPNSNQIAEKIKFKNIKTSIILAIVFYIIFISIILKMAIMPYSEFIYFNF